MKVKEMIELLKTVDPELELTTSSFWPWSGIEIIDRNKVKRPSCYIQYPDKEEPDLVCTFTVSI